MRPRTQVLGVRPNNVEVSCGSGARRLSETSESDTYEYQVVVNGNEMAAILLPIEVPGYSVRLATIVYARTHGPSPGSNRDRESPLAVEDFDEGRSTRAPRSVKQSSA